MANSKLALKDMLVLVDIVKEHYRAKGLGDAEFAKFAAEKMGREVTLANVKTARESINIPSNREIVAAVRKMDDHARIEALEAQMLVLSSRINTYFSTKG